MLEILRSMHAEATNFDICNQKIPKQKLQVVRSCIVACWHGMQMKEVISFADSSAPLNRSNKYVVYKNIPTMRVHSLLAQENM